MQTTISNRALVASIAIAAIFGMYFASTGVAEARVGSTGLNRSATSTNASSTKPVKQVNATCMSTAVEVRETALMTAWGDLNTSLTAGLTDRKTAFVAAWAMSDVAERSKALKTAWATWKTDKKDAHSEFKADRKAAWETFKTTVKSQCKVTLPKEEAMDKEAKDSVAI